MRHARQQNSGPDHERELTEEGKVAAASAGEWVAAALGVPDLVITSTATRTRQTWAAMARSERLSQVPTWTDRRIYHDGAPGLLAAIAEAPEEALMVVAVGHAPGVPALAAGLTDTSLAGFDRRAWDGLHEHYPPLTAAVLQFDIPWADLTPECGRLRLVHPHPH